MNKNNRVVWNDEKQCFVVASEWVRNHKASGAANLSRAVVGALLIGGLATAAIAGPGTLIKSSSDDGIHYFSVDDGGTEGLNYNNDGATGSKAIALGVDATAVNDSAVAIGADTTSSGYSAIAIGSNAKSEGSMGTAIGASAKAMLDNATAVGTSSAATARNSTALGFSANANGNNAIAAGYNSTASLDNTTALGYGASAKVVDGVALGSSSVANTGAGIAGYVPATATAAQQQAIANTKSTLAAVSVGDAATKRFRQITGVAAGTADSDAVNVAQLKGATADAVIYDDSTHNSVTLGGATYNPTTKTGGTKITNVANGIAPSDAVNKSQLDDLANTPLTFAGNTGSVQKKLGDTVAIQGKGSSPGTYVGDNLKTGVDANGVLQLQMTDAPVFSSVTTGNTTINTNGLTITGGPNVTVNGVDAGNKKIINVAAGTAPTDAVNVSQLGAATADAVMYDNSTHNSVTLGGPTYDATTHTGGTKITNVANGVAPSDAVNKSQLDDLAATPLTFAGNSGSVQKKLGDTIAIQGKGSSSGTYVGDNLKTGVDATGVLQLQMAA